MRTRAAKIVGLAAAALLLVGIPALAGSVRADERAPATAPQAGAKPGVSAPAVRKRAGSRAIRSTRAAKRIGARPRARRAGRTVRTASLLATSVELCAKAGTKTMPDGSSVDIWGFVEKPALAVNCSDPLVGPPDLPGPMLEATVGDAVNVTLHNALGENVSIVFPGQDEPPDDAGVPPGGSKLYSFTADDPGTYLYESGTNTSRQVPMGLYGAFVVHPSTAGQAYGSASSAFDQEAVLVLSEVDPALHANPGTFDLLEYHPKFWLINGKGYPGTAAISAAAGNKLLIRYLNAGLHNHTMTLVGVHQKIIAKDAFLLNFPYEVVAETLPSGQTADMIVSIPAGASGASFPLYNRQLHVTNGADFPGGMMTFVTVP